MPAEPSKIVQLIRLLLREAGRAASSRGGFRLLPTNDPKDPVLKRLEKLVTTPGQPLYRGTPGTEPNPVMQYGSGTGRNYRIPDTYPDSFYSIGRLDDPNYPGVTRNPFDRLFSGQFIYKSRDGYSSLGDSPRYPGWLTPQRRSPYTAADIEQLRQSIPEGTQVSFELATLLNRWMRANVRP